MTQNQNISQQDSRQIQMMKAVLPFVEQTQRQMLSGIIRLVKMQDLLQSLEQEEEVILSACSFEGQQEDREEALLQALKPYCSRKEQEMLEMFQNFRMASRFYQEYQHSSSTSQHSEKEGHSPNNGTNGIMPMDLLKNMLSPEQQNMMDMMNLMQMMHPGSSDKK